MRAVLADRVDLAIAVVVDAVRASRGLWAAAPGVGASPPPAGGVVPPAAGGLVPPAGGVPVPPVAGMPGVPTGRRDVAGFSGARAARA